MKAMLFYALYKNEINESPILLK